MARDADDGLSAPPHSARGETPPTMLRQPADPPPPLGRATDLGAVRALLQQQARRQPSDRPGELRARTRAWAGRVTGRAARRRLDTLTAAVEALAAHSDAVVERLNLKFDVDNDVSGVFGEEISRLRAEVVHLRDLVSGHDQPRT